MESNNTVITTVKIDKSKRDLAKAKGIKLQDVLDIALDNVLKLESLTDTNVLKEKEDAELERKAIESERETKIKNLKNILKDTERAITDLEREYKANLKELNKKLESIDDSIKEADKEYNIKLSELDLKIATLEDKVTIDIFELDEAKRLENKEKEYKIILDEYIAKAGDYKEEALYQKINNYAFIYDEELENVLLKLNDDFMAKLRANKRNL